jgi:sugar transferase (PEP-CTERM/EpsH1 system associated)
MTEPLAKKPALVYLCQRLPYPPTTGERIPAFNFLRHLSSRYRVFLGTFIDQPGDEAYIDDVKKMVSGLYVATIRKPQAYLRALPRWLAGEPISYALFRDQGLSAWLDRIEREEYPEALFVFSSNVSTYAVDHFKRTHAPEPFRFLHFCDVDSEKFSAYAKSSNGLKRLIFQTEARRVRREEQRLTDGADAVALISQDEASLLRAGLTRHADRVVTLPNGVDSQRFDRNLHPHSPFQGQGATFVFTGAMDYPPNIQAVTWFVQSVLPGIRARIAHAQFYIVGTRPTPEVKALEAQDGVIVTGSVESTAAYMAHAQVAVAPLQVARGVQNKVLEAMAMQLPVVVTQGAMTGIAAVPGEHVELAEGADDWVSRCVALIEQPERAQHMGLAARALVCDRYNWSAQFDLLDRYMTTRNQTL